MGHNLFSGLGQLADNQEFAGSNYVWSEREGLGEREGDGGRTVEQPGLDFAAHEAVVKLVVDDLAGGRLDSDDTDAHLLVGAGTTARCLGDGEQEAGIGRAAAAGA